MCITVKTNIKEETFETLETYRKDSGLGLNWSSVFVFPGFMKSWWDVCHDDSTRLFIRSVWQDGTLIGIAPLEVDGDTASFIGHKDVFDYTDFITVPGKETDFFNILLDYLKEQGINGLDLGPLRPDATVMRYLNGIAVARGYTLSTDKEDVTVELPLPPTWDDYLEALGGKERHEMRRKIRRLTQAGNIDFRIIGDADAISGVEDTFFTLFPESRGEKGSFMTEKMSQFFRTLIRATTESGILRFGILTLEAKILAMVLCFEYNEIVYLYNSVYDPTQSALSPGLLCKAFYIQDSIEQGKKMFDFLKGNEVYKYRMGGRESPIYRCRIGIK